MNSNDSGHKKRIRNMLASLLVGGLIVIYAGPRDYRRSNVTIDRSEYEESGGDGFVCLGYSPDIKDWHRPSAEIKCPAGYAILANSDSAGSDHLYGPSGYISVFPHCCRLPYDDILTDKHEYNVLESCPDNSVATSGMADCGANCTMRCTYINTKKYKLEGETQAAYVADPEQMPQGGRGTADYLSLSEVPVALRWVVTREGFNTFSSDGCVGLPFGSLLVRKSAMECSGYYYRRLTFKDGTPVSVVPNCDAISDIYDPNAKCLVRKK